MSDLDAAPQVRSHERAVKVKVRVTVGHAASGAAQDTVGTLGWEHTWSAHIHEMPVQGLPPVLSSVGYVHTPPYFFLKKQYGIGRLI